MSEEELKLNLIKLIVSQKGEALKELYALIVEKLKNKAEDKPTSDLESAYQKMAQDEEREKNAIEWIEGTLNANEL